MMRPMARLVRPRRVPARSAARVRTEASVAVLILDSGRLIREFLPQQDLYRIFSAEKQAYAAPARQPISQKSASSRVASLKIATSSASRIGVTYRSARPARLARAVAATSG